MSFENLGLSPALLKTIETSGYTEPSAVQTEAIPAALAGKDLLVSSHTGSGKTAAFLLPSLERLMQASTRPGKGPRVLVLAPTRELALQVEKAAWTYGKEMRRLRTAALVGGAPYGLQLKKLKDPVDIVVATPGRLMDHMDSGRIDFSRLEVLVLDEADRMLDMGFIDDIKTIVARTPETRQTLLFSATLDGVVGNLARQLTRDPQRIEVATPVQREANIDQRLLFADDIRHKNQLLDHVLRDTQLNQAVIFTATKRSAEDLASSLYAQGFIVDALHGDMQQSKRNRTLQRLRDGRTRLLVATDVAARGIDVAGITHVINYDMPRQAEDYVHRIGRTGRAGRTGTAVSLVNHGERRLLRDIERYTGNRIQIDTVAGLEPTARAEKPRRPNFSDKPKKSYGPRGHAHSDGARKAGNPQGGDRKRSAPARAGNGNSSGNSNGNWQGGYRQDGARSGQGQTRRRYSD